MYFLQPKVTELSFLNQNSPDRANETIASKNICAFMYLPGENYFLLSLEVKAMVGDLVILSNLFYESKLQVLSGSLSSSERGASGTWEFFVKPSDAQMRAEDLDRILRSCPVILRFKIKQSKDGFLVDTLNSPVRLSSGQRS